MAQTLSQAFQKHIKATPARMAKVAKEGHARILERHKPSDWVRRVDGKRGAPEEDVRPDGVIIYNYSYLQPIVDFAMETLRGRSPVESGAYRDGHTLFVGGKPAADVSGALPGETVFIGNPMPYARKIEIGSMTMRVEGTDHVYQESETIVHRRFGNQAWITFTYEGIEGGLAGDALGRDRSSRRKNVSAIRYPVLKIRMR